LARKQRSGASSVAPSRVEERLRFGDRDKDHCLGRKLRWLFIGARAQMQTLRREGSKQGPEERYL